MPPKQSGPIRNALVSPPPGAREPAAGPGAAMFGALENGVRTAYAVIDEYMRRGQEAARGMYNNSNRREYMSDYRGNYGGNYGGGFNPLNPFAMLTEQWMAAMRAWTEAFIPGAWGQMWNPAGYAAQSTAARISIQVSSPRSIEVTANLQPGSEYAPLVCDPLIAEGMVAPPIEDVSVTPQAGRVLVSIKVGAGQPAGRYSAAIRKRADGTHAGALAVVVGERL